MAKDYITRLRGEKILLEGILKNEGFSDGVAYAQNTPYRELMRIDKMVDAYGIDSGRAEINANLLACTACEVESPDCDTRNWIETNLSTSGRTKRNISAASLRESGKFCRRLTPQNPRKTEKLGPSGATPPGSPITYKYMENSKIEWTEHTFNPWMGCSKCSSGCDHCYASAMMGEHWRRVTWGLDGTRRRTRPAYWRDPLKWNKESVGARVFCASLADVFENYKGDGSAPDRPLNLDPWRNDLFDLIEKTPNLEWLLLTKRPQNAVKFLRKRLPGNVWIGTSVEDQKAADQRIPHLAGIPAKVRFLSCEPLLGPLDLRPHLAGVDWVIVGGEAGRSPRPMDPDWVRDIRDQCVAAGVAFHFKQWGGRKKKEAGRILDGRTWDEFPVPRLSQAA